MIAYPGMVVSPPSGEFSCRVYRLGCSLLPCPDLIWAQQTVDGVHSGDQPLEIPGKLFCSRVFVYWWVEFLTVFLSIFLIVAHAAPSRAPCELHHPRIPGPWIPCQRRSPRSSCRRCQTTRPRPGSYPSR